jgi:hypothetical protein
MKIPLSLCYPERTRISYFTALTSAAYVVLSKENHMQLTEAATLDRKSGEAEGSAVALHPKPMLRSLVPFRSNAIVEPCELSFYPLTGDGKTSNH